MVVEGDGHPILELDPLDRFPDGGDQAVLAGMQYRAEPWPDAPFVLLGGLDKHPRIGAVPPAVNLPRHLPADGVNHKIFVRHRIVSLCFRLGDW